MYEVSREGRLLTGITLVKDKGQRRVEDLAISGDGEWVAIAGNSPALYMRREGKYEPTYLEVDGDRLDEIDLDPAGRWAISFSHNDWRSWAALWSLEEGQPSARRIRILSAEGFNTAGRAMDPGFGQRHVRLAEDEATIAVGDNLLRIPLDKSKWRSAALEMVGRDLSDKEIREHLGGRDVKPLHEGWVRPLSVEKWEGTH